MTYLNINTKINSIRVNSNRSKGYGRVTPGLTDLPPVPIVQYRWTPEPIWNVWRRENYCPTGN